MIRVANLTMTYRSAGTQHHAVRDVSLEIKDGQFYTLLGPSGCGKTSTLRCIAGLERPDAGEIVVGDRLVCKPTEKVWVAPDRRNIGMVFQSYAIWPHMSVFENVAFPLWNVRPRLRKEVVREKVLKALALVKLDGLEDRPAPFLSGGQQQRLALARALVFEPRVLLLDEPLSNLDAKLREEMRIELRTLIKRLNVTTLFVTHEQVEALAMSDTISVMKDGRIMQEGSPAEIYAAPKEPFVADFIGKTNFISGVVVAVTDEARNRTAQVDSALGMLACPCPPDIAVGDKVLLAVRPENIAIDGGATAAGGNCAEAEIGDVVNLGNIVECTAQAQTQRLRVQVHPAQAPKSGERVVLRFLPERLLIMRG